MTHPHELLSGLLDGELTGEERKRTVRHLDGCEACRRELEELGAARAAVRSLVVLEPPPGLLPDGGEPLPVVPPPRRAPVWAAAAAAAILALFIGIATLLADPPSVEVSLVQLSEQYGVRNTLDPEITPSNVAPVPDEIIGVIE